MTTMQYIEYRDQINQLEQQKWTDKKSYLKWVKQWKSLYKELTLAIRKHRCELGKPHIVLRYNDPRYETSSGRLQADKFILRRFAKCMMEIRKIGKKESWKNKQTTKIEA